MTEPDFSTVPDCLRAEVLRAWDSLAPVAADKAGAGWERVCAALPKVFAASEFVAGTCARFPELLCELVDGGDLARAYDPAGFRAGLLARLRAGEAPPRSRLRAVRRREMLRIAWRDLAGWAELDETMRDLSALADASLEVALDEAHRLQSERYGEPIGEESGAAVRMVVLALGKLGGEELNFSSDIDLIFAYAEDGETRGAHPLSNHEFFGRVARELISSLSEATEDGIAFRVDMRLRPNGASGPLALSFDGMEHYYQVHGREWERYALIKARPAAGDFAGGRELLARLRPFVFRKYLDYGALSAIRELKEAINRELARKSAADNIKTGEGGIREIEFIGQAFQLIRGGRTPALQARRIQQVLPLAAQMHQLTPQAVTELLAAYRFLRDTEHRLQMAADRQTHSLPTDPCERTRIAFAMGFPAWDAFRAALHRHQRKVHGQFEQVFIAPQGEAATGDARLSGVWFDTLEAAAQAQALTAVGFSDDDVSAVLALLRGLRAGPAYQAFSAHGRERVDRLMALLLAAAGRSVQPLVTFTRLVRILEAIGRRSAYLALLIENPMALSQLVKLAAASDWIADWLALHPILLDELLNPATLYSLPDPAELRAELRTRLAQVPGDDLEEQMERMREFRHAHVLRAAAAEIGPGLAPEAAREHLCRVAEAILDEALELARAGLVKRHGQPRCPGGGPGSPGFAVIAYGKLGSFELGYGSDLDIIFLHEACVAEGYTDGDRVIPNELFFARLGQRLIHLLATRTTAGLLYQVDMRLRPSGQAGPLVTNLEAFRAYQREKAWVWEHQALVRARAVAGDARVRAGFAAVREEILRLPREPSRLRGDVTAMRERMRAAQPAHDLALFDLKQDPGGIVDIEFMVQYHVLRWAAAHPQLARHTENSRILRELAAAGLMTQAQAQELTAAYHRYLSIEQRLKLMDQRPLVAPAELADVPDRVVRIWHEVFDETT